MASAQAGLARLDRLARPDNLTQRVVDELRRALMSGTFAPGERMTIRAVADALGVSLTPAREALTALLAEGVLELGPGRTVHVPRLSARRLEELRVIRVALEGAAAEAAGSRFDEAQAARVQAVHEDIVELTRRGRYKAVMQRNREFHFAIYDAAGMPALVKLIEGCWLQTGAYINVLYPEFGDAGEGIANHAAAVRAVAARDGAALRAAIETDIRYAIDRLLGVLARRCAGRGA